MPPPAIEGLLQRLIRKAAAGHGFLIVCMGLSLAGTISAAYPITAVVVSAALLMPARWRRIAAVSALGSALGATVLVLVFHHLGWAQLYAHFPELGNHPTWARIIDWVSGYGPPALFLIAVSPLPQTPALIFFGIARHDYLGVFIAMLAGKAIKYGLFAWAAARFPERFRDGLGAWLGLRRSRRRHDA